MIRVLEILLRRRRVDVVQARVADLEQRAEDIVRARQERVADDYAAADRVVRRGR